MGKLMKIVGMVCIKTGLFSDLKTWSYLIGQCLRFNFFHLLISKTIICKKAHLSVVTSDSCGCQLSCRGRRAFEHCCQLLVSAAALFTPLGTLIVSL